MSICPRSLNFHQTCFFKRVFDLIATRVCLLAVFGVFVLSGCDGVLKDSAANESTSQQEHDLVLKVTRKAASTSYKPEDIQPYDEALAWHEYTVVETVSGNTDTDPKPSKRETLPAGAVVRVAHWTVLGGKAVPVSNSMGETVTLKLTPYDLIKDIDAVATSDELELDATDAIPRYLDETAPPENVAGAGVTPKALRMDYRGTISEQMQLYWKLRPQLKLVVMGNSHATKDVATGEFYGPDNKLTPMALNLAPPGSNLEFQCVMVDEYISPLPKLETLIWVVSPRNFNGLRSDDRKWHQFNTSPGRIYDVKNKAYLTFDAANDTPVTAQELESFKLDVFDVWGWDGKNRTNLHKNLDRQKKELHKQCDSVNFEFSEERFKRLTNSAKALADKGVKVILITVPFHPFLNDAVAADPDGTSHEGFKQVVKRFEEFDADPATPANVMFINYHQHGEHDFKPQEFYDADHLNYDGAMRLTEMLKEQL